MICKAFEDGRRYANYADADCEGTELTVGECTHYGRVFFRLDASREVWLSESDVRNLRRFLKHIRKTSK